MEATRLLLSSGTNAEEKDVCCLSIFYCSLVSIHAFTYCGRKSDQWTALSHAADCGKLNVAALLL